jgi:predicted glycoside hydrolase/deacetylase ChbG (UPF0249 family)
MKRIKLIAQDYGITFGVDRAIRELVALQRLSALAVIPSSELWHREAIELSQLIAAQPRKPEIGLTICLTAPFSPLSEQAFNELGGYFPTPFGLRVKLATHRISTQVIEREIAKQIATFVHYFGAPPVFIDCWRDIHLWPPVRTAIHACFTDKAERSRPWIARTARSHFGDRLRLRSDLDAGFPIGPNTLNAPISRDQTSIRRFFFSGLDFAREGTAVIVRPAIPDDRLRRFDRKVVERHQMWRFLASDEFQRILLAKDLFVF